MNAEDTKERIRQLRERVVSDPNSIVPGQDFSPLTEQRLKSVKSLQSVKKEGNPENLSANDLTTKLSLQTPNEIKKEFDSRYKKNFEMNEDQTLTDNQSNKNNSYLLEEIDSRVLNNSREFIKFFDEKFQKRIILPLSLSYDHRIIDGAEGAKFCNYLKDSLGKDFAYKLTM